MNLADPNEYTDKEKMVLIYLVLRMGIDEEIRKYYMRDDWFSEGTDCLPRNEVSTF